MEAVKHKNAQIPDKHRPSGRQISVEPIVETREAKIRIVQMIRLSSPHQRVAAPTNRSAPSFLPQSLPLSPSLSLFLSRSIPTHPGERKADYWPGMYNTSMLVFIYLRVKALAAGRDLELNGFSSIRHAAVEFPASFLSLSLWFV